jgi:hypothetical protein
MTWVLLGCAALLASLAVASYEGVIWVGWRSASTTIALTPERGRLYLSVDSEMPGIRHTAKDGFFKGSEPLFPRVLPEINAYTLLPRGTSSNDGLGMYYAHWTWVGFHLESDSNPTHVFRVLSLPIAYVIAILLGVSWWMARIARRSKSRASQAKSHCPTCNYDLRATPDRCPECGTTVLSAES